MQKGAHFLGIEPYRIFAFHICRIGVTHCGHVFAGNQKSGFKRASDGCGPSAAAYEIDEAFEGRLFLRADMSRFGEKRTKAYLGRGFSRFAEGHAFHFQARDTPGAAVMHMLRVVDPVSRNRPFS